jgi:putative endopeptidase
MTCDPARKRPTGGAFEVDRQPGQARRPVDRDEWFMTPQTVNAYYNPGLNEIVFPAAILQPPFFDVDADDAVNYGGIGAVIGHEIGHGFDDQGSQFDGTATCATGGPSMTARQKFQPSPTPSSPSSTSWRPATPRAKVNGALTVGENIGDLGRLTIGHAPTASPSATSRSGDRRVDRRPALLPRLGTGVAWAARRPRPSGWLALDPHAPMDLRANAVRNLDEFHEAFGVSPGDGLWVDPSDRVRIF